MPRCHTVQHNDISCRCYSPLPYSCFDDCNVPQACISAAAGFRFDTRRIVLCLCYVQTFTNQSCSMMLMSRGCSAGTKTGPRGGNPWAAQSCLGCRKRVIVRGILDSYRRDKGLLVAAPVSVQVVVDPASPPAAEAPRMPSPSPHPAATVRGSKRASVWQVFWRSASAEQQPPAVLAAPE